MQTITSLSSGCAFDPKDKPFKTIPVGTETTNALLKLAGGISSKERTSELNAGASITLSQLSSGSPIHHTRANTRHACLSTHLSSLLIQINSLDFQVNRAGSRINRIIFRINGIVCQTDRVAMRVDKLYSPKFINGIRIYTLACSALKLPISIIDTLVCSEQRHNRHIFVNKYTNYSIRRMDDSS